MSAFKTILYFFLLLLIQRIILDNLFIGEFERPFILFVFIIIIPNLPTWALLLIAFLAGLIYDIFNNTPGIHSFSSVLLAFLKDLSLPFLFDNEDEISLGISSKTFGFGRFLVIALVCSFIYNLSVILLTDFGITDVQDFATRLIFGTLSSTVLVYVFDILAFYRRKEAI